MNNADKQYKELLNKILTEGREKKSRAGDTIGIFGAQLRFNLQEGFPLLTTKKVHFNGILHELLWFLSGSSNIKYLVDNNVNIWNADAYRNYCAKCSGNSGEWDKWMHKNEDGYLRIYLFEEFVRKLETDNEFAEKWGELGEGTYGGMWRAFPYAEPYELPRGCSHDGPRKGVVRKTVDQISKLIHTLKTNPDSRRAIVSAWHPYWAEHCCLPPCHTLFQFHSEELTNHERNMILIGAGPSAAVAWDDSELDSKGVPKRRLNCQLYQRSCDVPLGGPYNIASYSLLTHLIAQSVGMIAGDFVWSIGDAHIYTNQIEGIKEQLSREPRALPTLVLNPSIKDIFDFKAEHIRIDGYDPHPAMKIPLSVG